MLLLSFPVVYGFIKASRNEANNITIISRDYAFGGALLILVFGGLSIYTLNNYFSPKEKIYTNADHHVIRIDGIDLASPEGFVISGNSNKALFDGDATIGELKIVKISEDSVYLESQGGFQQAIYREFYGQDKLDSLKLLNASQLISFKNTLYMKTRKGVYTFEAHYDNQDTMRYKLNGKESSIKEFISYGSSMSSLLSGLDIDSLNVNVDGLVLVRPKVIPGTAKDDRRKNYPADSFAVEILSNHPGVHSSADNVVLELSNDGNTWLPVTGRNEVIAVKRGDFFSIGLGNHKTRSIKFDATDNKILFRMPMMRYLSPSAERADNVVLLTQSLNLDSSKVDSTYNQLSENIILFDIFNHSDNINRIRPKQLAYTTGATDTKFSVDVYDYRSGKREGNVNGNAVIQNKATPSRIPNTLSLENPKISSWIVSLYDLKANSPYQVSSIKLKIMLFAIALALLLLFGSLGFDSYNKARRPMFSAAEFFLYMVSIYFVTLRWFLLWRASVFPPVTGVSWFEFNGLFQKTSNLTYFNIILIGFVVAIFLIKSWLISCNIRNSKLTRLKGLNFDNSDERRYRDWTFIKCKEGKFLAFALALTIAGTIYSFIGGMTWIKILMPILLYFVATITVHTFLSKPYNTDYINDSEHDKAKSNKAFYWDIGIALVTSGILLIQDAGYGILFFTFSMLWLAWEFADYLRCGGNGVNWEKNKLGKVILLALIAGLGILIVFYKEAIAFVANGKDISENISVLITLGAIGAILSLAVIIAKYGISYLKKPKKAVFIAIGVSIAVMVVGGIGFNHHIKTGAVHTAQRINVHVKDASQGLEEIDNTKTQRLYMQTALNHMIMGEYRDRGKNINLVGEDGVGYFKMQPHSKIGAMWGAQLSDISLVRYLIAEHSHYLGPILIAIFALLTFVGAAVPKHHRFARYLLIQIPLLLTIQSLLIWMANTQRFIFLGQDFPMVSINSTLAIAFYFSLVTIWLFALFYEMRTQNSIQNNKFFSKPSEHKFGLADQGFAEAKFIVFILAGLIFAAYFLEKPKGDYNTFDATRAMESVEKQINQDDENLGCAETKIIQTEELEDEEHEKQEADGIALNALLAAYQKGTLDDDTTRHLLTSMDSKALETFILQFNDAIKDRHPFYYDSTQKVSSTDSHKLGKLLWKRFVTKDIKQNNSKNVIYARLKQDPCSENKLVEIHINNRYYNQQLPKMNKDLWKGSILSQNHLPKNRDRNFSIGEANIKMLPGSWMRSGRETPLVSGKATLHGEGQVLQLARNTLNETAQLLPNMSISGVDNSRLAPVSFAARNVTINGVQTFIYPMGSSFYWMRNLAEEAGARINVPSDNSKDSVIHDLETTISTTLTKDIYNILSKKKDDIDRAVVIANGDGQIVAMVDYKKNYQINPNDNSRIEKILDSIQINGLNGSSTERKFFGNSNLMAIPNGPGSSQKPLVWTAVASGINYDWENLQVDSFMDNSQDKPKSKLETTRDGSKFVIRQFNGSKFLKKHPLSTLRSDENQGNTFGLREYMKKSSNVYNALMAYLGSWPKAHYNGNFMSVADTVDRNTAFARISGSIAKDSLFRENFPILKKNGERFRLNAQPVGSGREWLDNSLLQERMSELFGIHPKAKPQDATSFIEKIGGKTHRGYSYLEPSTLSSFERSQKSSSPLFVERAVRSTAIGAGNVWNITPVKMAESYGRMATLNKNYTLSLLKGENKYEKFDELSSGYLDARKELFGGMNDIFTSGTAAKLKNVKKTLESKGLYIYGKTGTIAPPKGKDQHRLGVLITNRNLETTRGESLADIRFYVLYFSFSRAPGKYEKWDDYENVLNKVIESPEFNEYMFPKTTGAQHE